MNCLEDCFIDMTKEVPETGCLLWTGYKAHVGYGIIRYENRAAYAHRVAWALVHGPIPPKMMVCHHCDVPLCVNSDHLFLGTAKDNMQDALKKGRIADHLESLRQYHVGKPKSVEHRAKISRAHIGKNQGPCSLEQRLKISQALKGRVHSAEHNLRVGLAHKGREKSLEHREKLRLASIAFHQRKKAC